MTLYYKPHITASCDQLSQAFVLTINRSRLNCNTINTKSIQRNIPKDTDIFSLASVGGFVLPFVSYHHFVSAHDLPFVLQFDEGSFSSSTTRYAHRSEFMPCFHFDTFNITTVSNLRRSFKSVLLAQFDRWTTLWFYIDLSSRDDSLYQTHYQT